MDSTMHDNPISIMNMPTKRLWIIFGIIVLLWIVFNSLSEYEYFDTNDSDSDKVVFPFRQMRDENNLKLPIICVAGFFRNESHKKKYYEYVDKGMMIIGCTAYKSFPRKISDVSEDRYHHTDKFDYTKNIRDWLCCLNLRYDSNRYGFTDWNRMIDISESDFYDIDEHQTTKIYDFIYICNKDSDSCPADGWNAINRNFDLAKQCFALMTKMGLKKGLIVGRVGCKLEEQYPQFTITDFLKWDDLQQRMRESKFLFIPNIYDASPRVVAECLTKGLPVLMNRGIMCGYKYINQHTGEFFTDHHDIQVSLESLIHRMDNNMYDTRKWWKENYGVKRSGERLREFIYASLLEETQNNSHHPMYGVLKTVANIQQIKFVI